VAKSREAQLKAERKRFEELSRKMPADFEAAERALPPEQRDAYERAQQSVTDALRSAENNEGLLRVS
jgi:hypothetical protein